MKNHNNNRRNQNITLNWQDSGRGKQPARLQVSTAPVTKIENNTVNVANRNTVVLPGSQAITNFTNGYQSQLIHVTASDYTTVKNSQNIKLNAQSDFNMMSGSVLTLCQLEPNVWTEISRRSPTHVLSNDTFENLDFPNSNTVRAANRFYPHALSGADESAAIYTRIDPVSHGNQLIGFYGEMTDLQQDTTGAVIKIIHRGRGDAQYIACFNDGVALEAASFYNGSRGIISTNQFISGSSTDFTYTTLFQGVWGYDGTGGSTTPPAYGAFYCALSLGNSFVTRKQSSGQPGAADGRVEWKIMEYDLARSRFEVYNTGEVRQMSVTASSAFTGRDAPDLRLVGSYWTGAAAQDRNAVLRTIVDATPSTQLRVLLGNVGSESLIGMFTDSGLDMQSHTLIGVTTGSIDRLGIGTGSPSDALHVVGDIRATAGFRQTIGPGYIARNITSAGSSSLYVTGLATDSRTSIPYTWIAPRAGSIMACTFYPHVTTGANVITASIYLNGNPFVVAGFFSGLTKFRTTFNKDANVFAAGDALSIFVNYPSATFELAGLGHLEVEC